MFYGIWSKHDGTDVKVRVLDFSTCSNGDGPGFRPVAIIVDPSDDHRLRYVELKFIRIPPIRPS